MHMDVVCEHVKRKGFVLGTHKSMQHYGAQLQGDFEVTMINMFPSVRDIVCWKTSLRSDGYSLRFLQFSYMQIEFNNFFFGFLLLILLLFF